MLYHPSVSAALEGIQQSVLDPLAAAVNLKESGLLESLQSRTESLGFARTDTVPQHLAIQHIHRCMLCSWVLHVCTPVLSIALVKWPLADFVYCAVSWVLTVGASVCCVAAVAFTFTVSM